MEGVTFMVFRTSFGGFLKWGYPKSCILIGFSTINQPFRVPPFLETPISWKDYTLLVGCIPASSSWPHDRCWSQLPGSCLGITMVLSVNPQCLPWITSHFVCNMASPIVYDSTSNSWLFWLRKLTPQKWWIWYLPRKRSTVRIELSYQIIQLDPDKLT